MQRKKISGIHIVIALLLIAAITFGWSIQSQAGINGAESRLIGVARSTFYYKGDYYRVKSTYINQLVNALDSKYDLSDAQVSSCINYIYGNIGSGVRRGYLYKIEVEEPEDSSGSSETEKPAPPSEVKDDEIIVVEETPKKSKDEILKETTDLANGMGLSVQFDNGKDEVTITDSSGNVLISTKQAVKNTGFRLNSILIFAGLILFFTVITILMAIKLKLFVQDEEDEKE